MRRRAASTPGWGPGRNRPKVTPTRSGGQPCNRPILSGSRLVRARWSLSRRFACDGGHRDRHHACCEQCGDEHHPQRHVQDRAGEGCPPPPTTPRIVTAIARTTGSPRRSMPEHTIVWGPGSMLSGMVTTALNLPFGPPSWNRLMSSGCRVNVTVDPRCQRLPLTVTWSPGLIVVSLTRRSASGRRGGRRGGRSGRRGVEGWSEGVGG